MAHVHIISGADRSASLPVVNKIGFADLIDALAKGMDDFRAFPSHAVFLVVIYPLLGFVIAAATLNYDLFPMLFPFAAGFALIGPLAAIGLYEMSRQRERNRDVSWMSAAGFVHSPSLGAIVAIGLLLAIIFLLWLAVARAIYVENFGYTPVTAIPNFIDHVMNTPAGWNLILVGNGVGFLFAVLSFVISVITFPLLLDRDVGAAAALLTSIRVVLVNPVMMALWGLIVAVLLVLGTLPFFVGLTVVLPVLGHATWHLYRKVVQPDSTARHDDWARHPRQRHYAAQFPASLFAGEDTQARS
jgi:uncharacterized membrane protein